MTDRHSGYHVVLAEDVREDDAEAVLGALRMVKGVAGVVPAVASYADVMARVRRDDAWRREILDLLDRMRS